MHNKNIIDRCLCTKKQYRRLFSVDVGDVVQCLKCGLVRTKYTIKTPRKKVYTKNDFSFYIKEKEKFVSLFENILSNISKFKKSGNFLEVGSSVGFLLEVARNYGFSVTGVEPGKWACAYSQKLLGTRTFCQDFRSARFKKHIFDVVVFNHVLEHMGNPYHELKEAYRVLKQNGLLVIGVPNFGSFMAKLKKSRWQSLVTDQHRWHFSQKTLSKLLDSVGFKQVFISTQSHDRSMHYLWKRPLYVIFDKLAVLANRGEAMLVFYVKK